MLKKKSVSFTLWREEEMYILSSNSGSGIFLSLSLNACEFKGNFKAFNACLFCLLNLLELLRLPDTLSTCISSVIKRVKYIIFDLSFLSLPRE